MSTTRPIPPDRHVEAANDNADVRGARRVMPANENGRGAPTTSDPDAEAAPVDSVLPEPASSPNASAPASADARTGADCATNNGDAL